MSLLGKNDKGKGSGFSFNIYWLYAIVIVVLLAVYYTGDNSAKKEVGWTEFDGWVQKKAISRIVVHSNQNEAEAEVMKAFASQVAGSNYQPTEGGKVVITTTIPNVDKFEERVEQWRKAGVFDGKVEYDNHSSFSTMFWSFAPFLLLVFFFIFMMRRMGGGGGGGVFSVGKARAKLYNKNKDKDITFADVAGMEREKKEVSEVVEFLKHPNRYTDLGGTIPKGVLLVGPPGTGKTLLAKAVAGEANVPFFSMSGSDFVEMFVGVGASRVRDLFEKAKEKSPCIIFIDEIEAIGAVDNRYGATNQSRTPALSQLLLELDGMGNNSGVIVLAVCNHQDRLDKSLLRAGRLDRHIYVAQPDTEERAEIFQLYLKDVKLAADVDLSKLAEITSGLSGADISKVCNDAAFTATVADEETVKFSYFEQAVVNVRKGLEDKSMEMGTIKFADVAGMEEAKREVTEIVDFLKHPEKYSHLGGRIPKGALLVGPPGTGKTMLAKAVAGEAHVPFFSRSGSEFVEMYVGVGASRVRELFA